jgi:hypothetical protein
VTSPTFDVFGEGQSFGAVSQAQAHAQAVALIDAAEDTQGWLADAIIDLGVGGSVHVTNPDGEWTRIVRAS